MIKDILKDHRFFPSLFLGQYSKDFKMEYKGSITSVYTIEDVSAVVERYTDIRRKELLVLDGVGFLSPVAVRKLLKFIEEASFPIALLSYKDTVPNVILSRMKFVFTKPVFEVGKFDFVSIDKCMGLLAESEDMKDYERYLFYAEHCPVLYYLEKTGYHKRVISLLGVV